MVIDQAFSGYRQTHDTLKRWCLINSYLATTRSHALTVLDAITRASRPTLATRAGHSVTRPVHTTDP